MTTPNDLLTGLRNRMKAHTTADIAKASGIDRLTVRKVRNNVNTGGLKMDSLFKLGKGLDAMQGVADND